MLRKLLSLLSDVAVYGISNLLSQVVGFLLLPLYTAYLDKVQYGIIGMLEIVTLVFVPLANLGMTNAIFRRFNHCQDDDERRRVLGTGLSSVVASSLALLILSVFAAPLIAQYVVGEDDTVVLVQLSLLSASIAAIGAVPRIILRAARRVRIAAALNVVQTLCAMVPTIWFVVVQHAGVRGVVLGNLTSNIVATTLAFACTVGLFQVGVNLPAWKQMLVYGLPFVPHHLQAVGLALFGQYVVREMLGLGEAGLYGVAMKFALPVTFVVNAVQTSWVAYKFQIHAEDDDPKAFFSSTFTYYIAALSYLWVGVCLWGPEMVRLMTSETFHDAALLIWAVSLIPVAQGFYYMSGTGLELSNNTKPMPLVSFAGLVVVIAGAFLLVRPLGALGAALATAAAWGAMSMTILFFAQRRFAISYDWPTIGCFVALASLCVLSSYMDQGMSLAFRLTWAVVLSLVYPLFGFLLLLRSRDERRRMLYLLTRILPVTTST